LHAPVSRLRGQAEREDGLGYLEAARVLFDLDDASPARSADEARGDEASGDEASADESPREPRDDE
jgi:hypothetical protein